jgi:pimeloyl-ACP methyl ester carboxylesterase
MDTTKPTIVLVHGAFAESASWNGVIERLHAAGYTVIAAANPIRSLDGDSAFVRGILESIDGPIVAVGHSYGGSVISNAAHGNDNVKSLVFVAAFAPEPGESIADLSGKFPGSTLGHTLQTVELPDGTSDLYIKQDLYKKQFADDVAEAQTRLDAAGQRPLNTEALNGKAGQPAWKTTPSWFVFPELDYNIPLQAHRFMADRANAVETIEVPGASHSVPVSHPQTVADIIIRATQTTTP